LSYDSPLGKQIFTSSFHRRPQTGQLREKHILQHSQKKKKKKKQKKIFLRPIRSIFLRSEYKQKGGGKRYLNNGSCSSCASSQHLRGESSVRKRLMFYHSPKLYCRHCEKPEYFGVKERTNQRFLGFNKIPPIWHQ